MATTFFLNDQPWAPARHNPNNRPNHRLMRSGPGSPNTGAAPGSNQCARLNVAAGVKIERDKIKVAVSAACIVLGATGTVSALLGFPVTGTILAVTGLFLLKLCDIQTN